jgi:hypothetical protein
MTDPFNCAECDRLYNAFINAQLAYISAEGLARRHGSSHLLRAQAEASDAVELARNAWKDHQKTHENKS